jgi:drug/metabolite transporter (DMT)-like permease
VNIVLLIVPILMWSYVGILVKIAAVSFAPALISFFRFFFGVVFLGLWLLARRRRPRLAFSDAWIWVAAAAKTVNYLAENGAIARGASWGFIVEQPVQAVAFLLISAFYFHERPGKRKLAAAGLCIVGALLVGVKGIAAVRTGGALDFLLFMVAACGSSTHMMGQKILMGRMTSSDMNISVFLVASVFTALPLPFSGPLILAPPSFTPVAAAVALGFITGASFLIWGVALSRVSFMASGIFANSIALFALLWGLLLRDERPDAWSLAGTAVFIGGLIVMNLPSRSEVGTDRSPRRPRLRR